MTAASKTAQLQFVKYPDLFAQHYNRYAQVADKDGLVALNTAFAQKDVCSIEISLRKADNTITNYITADDFVDVFKISSSDLTNIPFIVMQPRRRVAED